MNPMLRPSTNRPFSVPILMYSSASSGANAPLSRRRSTKQTAIQPSTFRISYQKVGQIEVRQGGVGKLQHTVSFLEVVTFSTARA